MYIYLPEESISPYKCDKDRMEQVLSILLNNALSYTKKDGVIHITLSKTDSFVEISVIDNGIGLGLSIAQDIINVHKGFIKILDSPGSGTTFTIQLPLKKNI